MTIDNVIGKIEDTLAERGKRYGVFDDHAAIAQELKSVMHECPSWRGLSHPYKEALEMIAHKIARVLNGDPDYDDSWRDIAGYARLGEFHAKKASDE